MSKQRSHCSVHVLLHLLVVFLVLNLFQDFRSQAQLLPEDEVKALRQIATKLNIADWKVNPSCPPGQGLSATSGSVKSNVTCDCTFNSSTICHVTIIELKTFNLQGELPVEFANLTYLHILDLSRNFLNGTIPRAWAKLPLVILSLLGNLITGTIPKEIGNIRTLEELVLQDNKMEGPIPKELGNLINLKRALLGGNAYTDVLPDTLGNLKNLTDFRIDAASLSGMIPEFIGNWTKLERLDMQGTSMKGAYSFYHFTLDKLEGTEDI